MWIKIEEQPSCNRFYPVWLFHEKRNKEFQDVGLYVNGTWYLDGGDTNIERTPYIIVAYYIVPDYK